MTTARTPGAIAYGMYQRRLHNLEEHIPLDYPRPFAWLSAAQQAAWEAAAQAVLARRSTQDTSCPVCGAPDLASRPPGLTADGDVHRDMTCEDCGATWVCVYVFRTVAYVHATTPQQEDTP